MAAQAEQVSPAKVFARSTADTIWVGSKQEEALNHLSGPALLKVVLGPSSSGKSTLLRYFWHHAEDTVVLPVSGPQKNAAGVLAALLSAGHLGPWNLSEIEQRNLLTVFLQQRCIQGKRIVVCIDNVSRFSEGAWSEIERLRSLQYGNKQLVEVVVVGTEADASRWPLDQLLQGTTSAIEAVYFLSAPSDSDIGEYISWRLAQYDIPNNFTDDAYRLINCLTRGRYNYVNILCQVILMEQMRSPAESIDAGKVNSAAASLASLKEEGTASDTVELKRLENANAQVPTPEGQLIVSCNRKVVRKVALNGRILIGRGDDNNLCLRSKYLSRHHAAILPTPEGHYFIVDLNSTNGVFVNGKQISHTRLYDHDVVNLCEFRLKVELQETGEVPVTPEATVPDEVGDHDDTDQMPAARPPAPAVRIVKR